MRIYGGRGTIYNGVRLMCAGGLHGVIVRTRDVGRWIQRLRCRCFRSARDVKCASGAQQHIQGSRDKDGGAALSGGRMLDKP